MAAQSLSSPLVAQRKLRCRLPVASSLFNSYGWTGSRCFLGWSLSTAGQRVWLTSSSFVTYRASWHASSALFWRCCWPRAWHSAAAYSSVCVYLSYGDGGNVMCNSPSSLRYTSAATISWPLDSGPCGCVTMAETPPITSMEPMSLTLTPLTSMREYDVRSVSMVESMRPIGMHDSSTEAATMTTSVELSGAGSEFMYIMEAIMMMIAVTLKAMAAAPISLRVKLWWSAFSSRACINFSVRPICVCLPTLRTMASCMMPLLVMSLPRQTIFSAFIGFGSAPRWPPSSSLTRSSDAPQPNSVLFTHVWGSQDKMRQSAGINCPWCRLSRISPTTMSFALMRLSNSWRFTTYSSCSTSYCGLCSGLTRLFSTKRKAAVTMLIKIITTPA
mmetsp:Transcript_5413/g.12288  ORF Transcript_5413/g.12288 Transcript_5413/m.12288 type:complete len:387 (-) Transcript_5413:563-1723(-)